MNSAGREWVGEAGWARGVWSTAAMNEVSICTCMKCEVARQVRFGAVRAESSPWDLAGLWKLPQVERTGGKLEVEEQWEEGEEESREHDVQGTERFPMNLMEGTRSAWAAAWRRALVANILYGVWGSETKRGCVVLCCASAAWREFGLAVVDMGSDVGRCEFAGEKKNGGEVPVDCVYCFEKVGRMNGVVADKCEERRS